MLLRPFFSLLFSGLLFTIVIVVWFPEYTKYYVKDNRIVENLGAQLYLLAGIVALVVAIIARSRKYIPILFSLMGFVFFLDEISWGRDELKFEPFKVLGVKIDSAHDFLDVFQKAFLQHGEDPLFLGSVALVVVALVAAGIRFRKRLAPVFERKRGVYLGMMALFFLFSLVSDLGLSGISKHTATTITVFEEYFELCAGLALGFIAITLFRDAREERAHS